MGFFHEHIILPLSDLATGQQVHKYLRLLKKAEKWTPEQMADFQKQRLQHLITYAANEVPFYHNWFHDHGLNPDTATLEQLPIIDKATGRHRTLCSRNFSREETYGATFQWKYRRAFRIL